MLLRSPVNHAIWQCEECEPFRKCNVVGNGKCEFSANQEARNWGANFLARKSAKLVANSKVHILARRSAKLIANFSATMVTSLPSFSLSLSVSLSLSLSPNVPHAQYRKRFRASYNRKRFRASYNTERERERDGSDVTIVALKLAMNSHFPLPKICTIGDELTLSLAKNSHFSILPSHFPSFPSRRGHHGMVALKFAMSSHFPLPKNVSPSGFVPPLSNGTSRATSDRKPKTKWSNLAQSYFVLPIEKLNQINTKNYWK